MKMDSIIRNIRLFFFGDAKHSIRITKLHEEVSFLYSDKQEINIKENINLYELKFKKEFYYNNQLILYNERNKFKSISFTEVDNGEEIKIEKEKLIQILSYSGETFKISQITNYGLISMNSIFDISINYLNPQKINIYLNITKLLTPSVDRNTFIAYETNITDIPKITTDYFNITNYEFGSLVCLLKKNSDKINDTLLLLCHPMYMYRDINCSSLGKKEEMVLDNINILYNFIISYDNNETFTMNYNRGSLIYSVYPE